MDLSFLTPLYAAAAPPGTSTASAAPVATCYLDTSWDVGDAAHAVALRWRAARDALARDGVDEDTLTAMDAAVAEHRPAPGRHGLALFAAGGRVCGRHTLPVPPAAATDAGPLPHVLPLLLTLARTAPHVLVSTDRVGADITAYGPDGPVEQHVDGPDDEVTKHRGGGYRGWSQHRYAQRVENAWEHNARAVAGEVDRLVATTGSQLLLVGGDTRARAALRGHLARRSLAVLREADHAGRTGAGAATLADASLPMLADLAAGDRRRTVTEFARERGHAGRATEGTAAVTAACREARAAAVLVRPDVLADLHLWVGPDPCHLATDAATLRTLDVDSPWHARADAALVRALVATHATLVPVTADDVSLDDGVGALLR